MELRPPASASNEDIYQLLGHEELPTAASVPAAPAGKERYIGDVASVPRPRGAREKQWFPIRSLFV